MIDSSAITHEEAFRLNGTLSEARIEALLEEAAGAPHVEDIGPKMDDARGQFPDEDFLDDAQQELREHLDDLKELASKVRGNNKAEIQSIIERLEKCLETVKSKVQDAVNSAEEGRASLSEALDLIGY
jgi:ElaB/YqjD/DUF883 family membrane-anchored ribosome-binding protein